MLLFCYINLCPVDDIQSGSQWQPGRSHRHALNPVQPAVERTDTDKRFRRGCYPYASLSSAYTQAVGYRYRFFIAGRQACHTQRSMRCHRLVVGQQIAAEGRYLHRAAGRSHLPFIFRSYSIELIERKIQRMGIKYTGRLLPVFALCRFLRSKWTTVQKLVGGRNKQNGHIRIAMGG